MPVLDADVFFPRLAQRFVPFFIRNSEATRFFPEQVANNDTISFITDSINIVGISFLHTNSLPTTAAHTSL